MPMNVLVTGNGFDIDLGLKTRYSDFVKSTQWKSLLEEFNVSENGMFGFITQKATEMENWFNLEDCLAEYVSKYTESKTEKDIKQDILFFKELKEKLYMFIEYAWGEDGLNINKGSIAYRVYNTGNFANVYTFNFTYYDALDFKSVPQRPLDVYLHGEWGNVVIGIGEDECTNRQYSFLVKTNSDDYPKTNVVKDLIAADEIIVFGFSFCDRDSGIFRRLLEECWKGNSCNRERRITIITWDEMSINDIKMQFNRWGFSFDVLNSLTDFTFIAAKQYYHNNPEYVRKVDNLLERLISVH